jgi:hypothetical protein
MKSSNWKTNKYTFFYWLNNVQQHFIYKENVTTLIELSSKKLSRKKIVFEMSRKSDLLKKQFLIKFNLFYSWILLLLNFLINKKQKQKYGSKRNFFKESKRNIFNLELEGFFKRKIKKLARRDTLTYSSHSYTTKRSTRIQENYYTNISLTLDCEVESRRTT